MKDSGRFVVAFFALALFALVFSSEHRSRWTGIKYDPSALEFLWNWSSTGEYDKSEALVLLPPMVVGLAVIILLIALRNGR